MKRTTLAALALLAACAPAAGPEAPAPDATPAPAAATAALLNPVGTYEFTAFFGAQEVARGTMEITGQPGAYGGRIRANGDEDVAITRVTIEGRTLTVNAAETPDGPITLTLTVTGDTFLGRWSMGDEEGEIRGQRRP